MQRKVIQTGDGSTTIEIPELEVTYHSRRGALTESLHVFIQSGLHFVAEQKKNIRILEMGLGTGLNTALTIEEGEKRNLNIEYCALEAFPLEKDELQTFESNNNLQRIWNAPWNEWIGLSQSFNFRKDKIKLQDFQTNLSFDLIYYDAFAPAAQPELWTEEIFKKLYSLLNESGVLVTYCSKSQVRKAMQAAGFNVSKLPGPPGKREIVRAVRERNTD